MKKIDTRTEAEKALPADESVTLGLTIYPEGVGVVGTIGFNTPGGEVAIALDLGFDDEGSPRYGLTTGQPFNEVGGIDGLIEVLETYVRLLQNPAVRHAFVEDRIQPTAPTLFDDTIGGYDPTLPNHYIEDGLGHPDDCEEHHNHPPRGTTDRDDDLPSEPSA